MIFWAEIVQNETGQEGGRMASGWGKWAGPEVDHAGDEVQSVAWKVATFAKSNVD